MHCQSEEQESELALLSSNDTSPITDPEPDDEEDLEANRKNVQPPERSTGPEYQTPNTVKFISLTAYFGLSMGMTIYNKFILGSFKVPWLLACLHTTFNSTGAFIMMKKGYFKLSELTRKEHLILAAFSVLFTSNIAMSNLSLSLVSLAFFQIIRNTVPLFTVLIYRIWFARSYATATYFSLIPIVAGAGMCTAGDYHYTVIGLAVTIAGVILAAAKLLFRMSLFAAVQSLVFGIIAGEIPIFYNAMVGWTQNGSLFPTLMTTACILGNGLLAFFSNVASFNTNKIAGALTTTVCANLKQAITLALGIVLLGGLSLNVLNGLGIFFTLAGCVFFSKSELDSKRRAASN